MNHGVPSSWKLVKHTNSPLHDPVLLHRKLFLPYYPLKSEFYDDGAWEDLDDVFVRGSVGEENTRRNIPPWTENVRSPWLPSPPQNITKAPARFAHSAHRPQSELKTPSNLQEKLNKAIKDELSQTMNDLVHRFSSEAAETWEKVRRNHSCNETLMASKQKVLVDSLKLNISYKDDGEDKKKDSSNSFLRKEIKLDYPSVHNKENIANTSKGSNISINRSYSKMISEDTISSDFPQKLPQNLEASKPIVRSKSVSISAGLRLLDQSSNYAIRRKMNKTDIGDESENTDVFTSDDEMFIPKRPLKFKKKSVFKAPLSCPVDHSSGDEQHPIVVRSRKTRSFTDRPKSGNLRMSEHKKDFNKSNMSTKKGRCYSMGTILNFDKVKDQLLNNGKAEVARYDTSGEFRPEVWNRKEDTYNNTLNYEDVIQQAVIESELEKSFPSVILPNAAKLDAPEYDGINANESFDSLELTTASNALRGCVWCNIDFPDRQLNVTALAPRPARLTVRYYGIRKEFCNERVTFLATLDLDSQILLHCDQGDKEIFRLLMNKEVVGKYGVKTREYTIFFTAKNESGDSLDIDIKMDDKQSFDNAVWTLDNQCRQNGFKIQRGRKCE